MFEGVKSDFSKTKCTCHCFPTFVYEGVGKFVGYLVNHLFETDAVFSPNVEGCQDLSVQAGLFEAPVGSVTFGHHGKLEVPKL